MATVEVTHYCRGCGLVLTMKYEILGNTAYVSWYCADHPAMNQGARSVPILVEGH